MKYFCATLIITSLIANNQVFGQFRAPTLQVSTPCDSMTFTSTVTPTSSDFSFSWGVINNNAFDVTLWDHSSCSGQNHAGADWTLNDGDIISGIHCNVANFVIPTSASVSVRDWNGTDGTGRFEVYAQNVDVSGTLTANGKGYRGGSSPTRATERGFQGESFNSASERLILSNVGGGGGGGGENDGSFGYGKSGGGGGYGETGGICSARVDNTVHSDCGEGGQTYGDEQLSVLHLGSGGGSGGNDDHLTSNPIGGRGGNGGGAIRLDALESLQITGSISANGDVGQGDETTACGTCPTACSGCINYSIVSCWDYSGVGGGGSGGSVFLRGQSVGVGSNLISVDGGRGGYGSWGGCAGDGGRGRIRIDYVTISGQYPSHAYTRQHNFTNVVLGTITLEGSNNVAATLNPDLRSHEFVNLYTISNDPSSLNTSTDPFTSMLTFPYNSVTCLLDFVIFNSAGVTAVQKQGECQGNCSPTQEITCAATCACGAAAMQTCSDGTTTISGSCQPGATFVFDSSCPTESPTTAADTTAMTTTTQQASTVTDQTTSTGTNSASDAGNTEGTSDAANTEGTSDAANTEGTSDAANTEGTSDAANTEGTSDAANTEGTSDAANTEGTSDAENTEGTTPTIPEELIPVFFGGSVVFRPSVVLVPFSVLLLSIWLRYFN